MTTRRAASPIARLAAVAASGVAAVSLLVFALPRLAGASWTTINARVLGLSASQIGILAVVWLAGLFVHTYVMIAALPTLNHRQAMMLNFSGSAVSNLVPFGGVLGMGVNYSMLRSWGFSRNEFTLMTVLTTAWTVMAKLALPSLALGMLLIAGGGIGRSAVATAVAGLLALGLVGVAAAAAARRRGSNGDTAHAAATLRARIVNRVVVALAGDSIAELRDQGRATVRRHWHRLTLGAIGYALLQALLLGLCLHAFGTGLSPVEIFAGFAVGSMLTLVPITPGGLGISETGTAALLVALGGEPVATTAAILLFRMFTFLLEIPAGAACTAGWWLRRPKSDPLLLTVGSADIGS